MRILIIDESDERARVLEEGLRDGGYADYQRLREMSNLVERIAEIDPELILIDLENPNRDTVEQMFRVSREVKRPIAMFVDDSDPDMIGESVRAGVSSYIVDGLKRERVRPIVEIAISRFQAYRDLENRASKAEVALHERKQIDRAKGLLMQRKGLSEQQAYETLRDAARSHNRKMVDVAASVLAAGEIGL